jgi:hypothetical protein
MGQVGPQAIIKKLFVSPRPDRVRKKPPGQKSFLVKKSDIFFFKSNLDHVCFQCQHYTAEYDWSAYLRPSDADGENITLSSTVKLKYCIPPIKHPYPSKRRLRPFQFWNMKSPFPIV